MDEFVITLHKNRISAIADVRSSPYSKFKPEFNKNNFRDKLKEHNIEYVFIGDHCGARIDSPDCYTEGQANFSLIAKNSKFLDGLSRIKKGLLQYSIALLCAEKDPIKCHRMILICRQLKSTNIDISHIIEPDLIESNAECEERLMKLHGLDQPELFRKRTEQLEDAYDRQSEKIAFKKEMTNSQQQQEEDIEYE
jgi:hypothetical protein